MSLPPVVVILLCAACALLGLPVHAMIWVGTPVGLSGDPILGPTQGELSFETARLQPCGGGSPLVLGPSSVALGAALPLPAGSWCGLTLEEVVLVVWGQTSQGQPLDLEIEAEEVVFDVSAPVTLAPGLPAPPLELFAPGWLSELGVNPNLPVDIGPGHPLHAALSAELSTESAW